MSALLAGSVLAAMVVTWILQPLVTGRSAPTARSDEEVTEAQHRKRMALLALRDVEYDFHAGKLDERDYRLMKQEVSSEALAALDEEEAEWKAREGAGGEAGDADVESEIAALRASLREGAVCRDCGEPNPPGSRFCGDCGAALPGRSGTPRPGETAP